ncbi:pentatricopeptide repeat-containing protein At5g66520-like [Impatiens glandulifera]|uniref:pentatricopeptide repeat-containing protein At5g66520-like n=1 Tax=Impatiens glandulifera TaxID=253017 RepID=UPI001FB0F457|nr:pentatricopeptide repeat-containing protein At5g66520-like [Impatiens glandulifera]
MVATSAARSLISRSRALSLLDQPWLTLIHLKQIHSRLIVSGATADDFTCRKLLSSYSFSAHGELSSAYNLFRLLPRRSIVVSNTMIRAFLESNEATKAVILYREVLASGILPDKYTFSFLLRACVEIADPTLGVIYHAQIIKLGWERHEFVQNGLIHFYVSLKCMESASKLFDGSSKLDVVAWTSLINGYLKSGQIVMARELFDKMPVKNEVSWSAMVNGYAQFGLFNDALELFNDMQLAGIFPNYPAIVGALSACAALGALDQGQWIHSHIKRNKLKLDTGLGTALVHMYTKCGCIETACQVFDKMSHRDVYAYTCFISGLANHGQSSRAIHLFTRMCREGINPNEVTFTCILNACSRMGLIEEGLKIFHSMYVVYGIQPKSQHYGCLVDLLGRAGMMEQAKLVVEKLHIKPDSCILGAMLNACGVHGELELGKEIVEKLVDVNLDHSGTHVLLSNILAQASQWNDVEKLRKEMVGKMIHKVPGCSAVEVNGVLHEFISGEKKMRYC